MLLNYVKREIVYLISLVDILAVSLIVPLFNEHLQSLGLSNTSIGFLNSAYSLVQFIASPWIGHLCDVYNSKAVLIGSLLICAACYPLVGLATSFWTILLVRAALGLIKHTQLLCKNVIQEIDASDQEQFRRFGKLNGYTSLGFIAGPIIGGHLSSEQGGFGRACSLTGVLFAVNAAFVYAFVVITRKSRSRERSFWSSLRKIPWSVCWDLFLLKSLSAMAVIAFYVNYFTHVRTRYGISVAAVGYSFAFQGCIRAMTGFAIEQILKWLPSRFDLLSKIRLGYALLIATFLSLCYSSNIYVFMLLLVPLNVSVAFIRIVNHELLVQRSKGGDAGIMMGAFNNVTAICRLVMPILCGYIVDHFSYDSVYAISITCCVVGVSVISWCQRDRLKLD